MRLLPLLPVVLSLAVVAVLRPDLLTDAAGNWRAWLVAGGVALIASVTRLVVRRWSPGWAAWASSAVALALLGSLLLPSFHERTVNEVFPAAETSTLTIPQPTASAAAVATAAAPTTPIQGTARATTPTQVTARTKTPIQGTPRATPRRLATGPFQGIGHRASGRATLYELAGRVVVRFEDINFQGTPNPVVYLVRRGSRTPGGGVRLADLKAEHGSFSYRTPAGFDGASSWTVLVWCERYATPIAAADLR